MLSFEMLCAQEGQLDKENFGMSKLITALYPHWVEVTGLVAVWAIERFDMCITSRKASNARGGTSC